MVAFSFTSGGEAGAAAGVRAQDGQVHQDGREDRRAKLHDGRAYPLPYGNF